MLTKDSDEPIRIWSAGCASGEEAYTLAMVIAEFLGTEAFHKRVKIYATDMDADALIQARQAVYSLEDVKSVPDELLEKYFTHNNSGEYAFNIDLRRAVIFGEHDLVQDAPISRLDLLVCRNTLMYFNAETQGRILARFHFALNDNGILFLGKAEMLLTHTNLFSALEVKYRYFTKVSRPDMRDRLLSLAQTTDEQISNRLGRLMRVRDLAFDLYPEAQIIVDNNAVLIAMNLQAKNLFSLAAKDIGNKLNDMEICYQPLGLRPLIDQVLTENKPLVVPSVEMRSTTRDCVFFDVHIIPIQENGNRLMGVSIVFVDVSLSKNLEEQLRTSTAELETANKELQSTNEELETTNEELQSTVEELETINEELQSTNEELETMNEELQSTNEELETLNDELNQRTTELNGINSFLETILNNLKIGVIVVDQNFRVQNWNSMSEELWGLRSSEIIGQSFLSLDIGLPVENLKQPIRTVLETQTDIQQLVFSSVNRSGRSFDCRITCTPYFKGANDRLGAILVMEIKPEAS